MRTVLRYVKLGLLAIVGLAVLAIAIIYGLSERELRRTYDVRGAEVTVPTDAASLARGKHLAENVAGCRDCHGQDYGGYMFFDGGALVARLPAPNLTRGRGGIGADYTDADWVRALRHGLNKAGRPLVFMPSQELNRLPASDIGALIAHLKSVPPVDRELPARAAGLMGRLLILKDAKLLPARVIDHTKAPVAALPTDIVALGDELTSVAGCKSCHSPDLTGGSGPPPGAANLTPVGIGSWTRDQFVAALRTGRTPDHRELAETMPRALGNMTDEEMDAIWAYLRTLAPRGEKSARQRGPVNPVTN